MKISVKLNNCDLWTLFEIMRRSKAGQVDAPEEYELEEDETEYDLDEAEADLDDDESDQEPEEDEPEEDEPEEDEPEEQPQPKAGYKRIDRGRVMALSEAGWNVRKIADDVGCSEQAVYYILRQARKKEKSGS